MKVTKVFIVVLLSATLSACSNSGSLNPFAPELTPQAKLGQRNDHALDDSRKGVDKAREAAEQMASYQRSHTPQPVNPVIQPAVVRLMWIPDHLNSHGDLVPAHYYYLKVLSDRWAVTDAFELEGQLSPKGASSSNAESNLPYVYSDHIK
ncbi:MAG: hypothetical protein KDD53_01965 [Bdellovibrionales bacterium]|nr:hypothetical protein [Bdellovibrionales bacterium]